MSRAGERAARWVPAALLVAYAAYALWALLLGERIPVNQGLGWDGKLYFFMAYEFVPYVKGKVMDSYYALRVLPSLIIKAVHGATGIDYCYRKTGTLFGLLNLVSMLGGTGLLASLVRQQGRPWAAALATTMALISFGSLRHPYFYPMLTDCTAFGLGALMLWAHLRGRRWLLFAAAMAGAFTVALLPLLALPLLVLRNERATGLEDSPRDRAVMALAAAVVLALGLTGPAILGTMPFGMRQPPWAWALLALPISAAYLPLLLHGTAISHRIACSLRGFSRQGLALAFVMVSVIMVVKAWAKPSQFGALFFPRMVVASSVGFPALPLVAHVAYLGPLAALLVVRWVELKRVLAQCPLPLFFTGLIALAMLLASESRALAAALPFIIYLLVQASGALSLSGSAFGLFLALSLVLSKCWFVINAGEMGGDFLQHPMQRYYMHFGPWMNGWSYAAYAFASAGCVAVLWWAERRWGATIR